MKAVRLLQYGGQLVFNDVPMPAIARDEILVRMRPTPGRTSPGTCQRFMGCRPVGRERQDASHTARSCFVWPKLLQ
jgi:hypothetical protein